MNKPASRLILALCLLLSASAARALDPLFAPAVNYAAVGIGPWSVSSADLDGDGDFDLAVANKESDNVGILKNNGNGTFVPYFSYEVGTAPLSIFSADLDGDDDYDLAVANHVLTEPYTVSVLENSGDGTFQPAVFYIVEGQAPTAVFLADLDGDGDYDLAVTTLLYPYVSILLNDGDGTFAPAASYAVDSWLRQFFRLTLTATAILTWP